ncbi:MAG: hypothetical protein FWE20_10880 [Defluviitaleaceae bacterium]|nr:hypothetical protein [Defluviitaleaceae bacterium]
MGNPVDKRGLLDSEVFTYRVTKDNKVFISYYGKQVTILKGGKAEDFIADIADADGKEAQLIMAKVTGNFHTNSQSKYN